MKENKKRLYSWGLSSRCPLVKSGEAEIVDLGDRSNLTSPPNTGLYLLVRTIASYPQPGEARWALHLSNGAVDFYCDNCKYRSDCQPEDASVKIEVTGQTRWKPAVRPGKQMA